MLRWPSSLIDVPGPQHRSVAVGDTLVNNRPFRRLRRLKLGGAIAWLRFVTLIREIEETQFGMVC